MHVHLRIHARPFPVIIHCFHPAPADSGIPEFWLTAITNHDMLGEYVSERDAEVLVHLRDVRADILTGDDAGGFKLVFTFDKNDNFSNTVGVLVVGW